MKTTSFLTNVDASDLAAVLFDDLTLTETAANKVKRGRDLTAALPLPSQPRIGCSWGPPVLNHNETVAEDAVAVSDTLTDLRLTDAELDGIKGGPVCHGTTVLAWARVDGVSAQSNHNETVAEDFTQAGEVEDLPLTTIQDQDVKAGGWGSSMYQYAYNDPNYSRPPAAGTLTRPFVLEDLPVQADQTAVIKGGPVEIKELTIHARVAH